MPQDTLFARFTAVIKMAGRPLALKAAQLYYAARSPATPKWARRVIWGALLYFVVPLDAIPDVVPIIGFSDDLGILAAALATVAIYINDDIKSQANIFIEKWLPQR